VHVLSATGLSKSYDGRELFRDVALGVQTGDRIGLVGPNGSGKSTLLQILAGTVEPDTGEVVPSTGARIRMLAQQPRLPEGSATEAVIADADADVRDHEAEAMLDKLGIDPDRDVQAMSGGQKRRVALATVLVGPADLLILDEPTNHLDVWTVDWLEDELRDRRAGLLLVTHDRRMLEGLTTRLLELDPAGLDPTGAHGPGVPSAGGGAYWHEGGYSTLLEAREERERRRQKAEQRRANRLRKEIEWLRRQPKARGTKPKFREDQARQLQAATPSGEPGQLDLGTGRRRLGSQVIDVEDVALRYDPDGPDVVRDFSYAIGPGQRLGVVGPNGAGKTTLLRLLLGELEPTRGSVEHGPTVEVGVYRQEARVPPVDTSALDTVLAVAQRIPLASGETLSASRLAERFNFPPRLQRTAVADLSGGERRRLALLHLLVAAPNVLVLDEPTNDLDLDTLSVLEDHLDGFRGTLIVASHDRFVLDRLTDELLAVRPDGRVTRHLDWEHYREQAETERAVAQVAGDRGGDGVSQAARDHHRRKEQARALRKAETQVDRLTELRDQLDEAMAAEGTGHEQLAELARARDRVMTQLTAAEEHWLELAERSQQG
jgi:ATP-binding cassette subfamily F protein uup